MLILCWFRLFRNYKCLSPAVETYVFQVIAVPNYSHFTLEIFKQLFRLKSNGPYFRM